MLNGNRDIFLASTASRAKALANVNRLRRLLRPLAARDKPTLLARLTASGFGIRPNRRGK